MATQPSKNIMKEKLNGARHAGAIEVDFFDTQRRCIGDGPVSSTMYLGTIHESRRNDEITQATAARLAHPS